MTDTPILCPDCGHDIDDHDFRPGEWDEPPQPPRCNFCKCPSSPSDIARALLAERDAKLAERDAKLAAVREISTAWYMQPTDYDEDTEQQIEDGQKILRILARA